MAMKQYPESGGIANGGEAVGMSSIFTYFIGFVFLITCTIRGSTKNGDSTFYLWFALAILIPIVIVGNI